MKKVLFIGDINVDVILGGMKVFPIRDREITCESYEVVMGSTAVISAAAYASLGGSAAFLGLAGRDDHGEFMLRGMNELGIDTYRVRRTSKVRTGVTVNMLLGRTRTQVTYPGTIAELDGADIGERELRGLAHVHFAGPYQQTRLRPHITRLLSLARRLGLSTSLDPQWDLTGKWAHLREWLPLLTYFFPNADEAMAMTGAATPRVACAALMSLTACSLVKAGKKGVIVPVDGYPEIIATPDVKVVDTTGAGDSFNAGFLYSRLVRNLPVRESATFANAVAARSCLFIGGVTARSTHDQIVRFMKEHP